MSRLSNARWGSNAATLACRSAFLLAALLYGAREAAAKEPATTRLRVRYEAPALCPDAASFRHDLLRRSTRIALADAADRDASSWDVRVVAVADGYVGSLRPLDVDAEPHVQRGARCDTVASAIALTLALTIDPESRTDSAPEPTKPPEIPLSLSTPTPTPTPSPPPTPTFRRRFAIGVGASGLAAGFNGPLGGLFASVESRDDARRYAPIQLRARIVFATQAKPEAGQQAKVTLGMLGLDVCVFALRRERFALRPCLGLEPGVARGRARSVARASDGSALWLSTSARLRGEYWLEPRFGFLLEGAAVVPLVRSRFVIDPPRRTVSEAAPAGAEIALSAAFAFP